MNKYGFRIRTRGGMLVENLQVQAHGREEAEQKIRQIYHQCEIIECQEVTPTLKKEGLDLEDVIALINREEPARAPQRTEAPPEADRESRDGDGPAPA